MGDLQPPQKRQKTAPHIQDIIFPQKPTFNDKFTDNLALHRKALSCLNSPESDLKFELLPTTPMQSTIFPNATSSGQISEAQLDQCYKLLKRTSADDYKRSSRGWNPKEKKIEMRDKDFWYILVTRPDPASQADPNNNSENKPENEAEAEPNNVESPPSEPTPPLQLLGFTSFMFTKDDPPFEDRDVGYIYEIHLEPQLRGHGLGSGLIKFVETIVLSVGIEKVMLTVFTRNTTARRVYEKLGYREDACSPEERRTRRGRIRPDYMILSKALYGAGGEGAEGLVKWVERYLEK